MRTLTPNTRRTDVERDVAAYLARGGAITKVPSGVSGVDSEARKRLHVERAKKAAHARRSKTKGGKP